MAANTSFVRERIFSYIGIDKSEQNTAMPQLYVISGCNGAGKTTASYALLPEMLGCSQFVNSDEFAKSLSPFSPDAASIQASKLMLLKMNYLFKRNEDFAIETTLATRSLKKTIAKARAQGYGITILYFWLNSLELAVERVRARVAAGGHNIPEETIRRRYTAGLHYFFNIYRNMADRWILADNSQIPFRVVAEGQAGRLTIKDEQTYSKIQELADFAEKSLSGK